MKKRIVLALPFMMAITLMKVKADTLPIVNNEDSSSTGNTVASYSSNYDPTGVFDTAEVTANKIRVTGWAFDKDDVNATSQLEIYLDNELLGTISTDSDRPDVNSNQDITGVHGFIGEFVTNLTGSHTISIYALDLNGDYKVLIGQKTISIQGEYTNYYIPQGWVDEIISKQPGTITLSGWAFDLDMPDQSIQIRAYASGTLIGETTANKLRSDVNKAFSINGSYGYSTTFSTTLTGDQTISIYALDPLNNQEKLIGSKNVTIQPVSQAVTQTSKFDPVGSFDYIASNEPGTFYVAGWGYDQDDLNSAIKVNVYIDDKLTTTLTADQAREDVNKAFSVTGNHGFRSTITTDLSGIHTVKITLQDLNTSKEVVLGEKTVDIQKHSSHNPKGCVDIVTSQGNQTFYIAGWAYDEDSLNSNVEIKVYANAKEIASLQANQARSDVNKAFSITGNHGFSGTITTNLTGKQTLTIKMVDIGTDEEYVIDTKEVEFQKSYTTNSAPVGYIDQLESTSPGKVKTSGWAYDLDDLSESVEVEIYEGATLIKSISANKLREDVNKVYGITGSHGFSITFDTNLTGSHTFTYKLKDLGTNKEIEIGKKSVVIQKSFTSNFDPIGCLDGVVSNNKGEIYLSGWIFDKDDLSSSTVVNVYEGNNLLGSLPANQLRSDLNSLYKIIGNHGFAGTIQTGLTGVHDLTFKMEDLGTGKEYVLANKSVDIKGSYTSKYDPYGVVDLISYDESGSLYVAGWVFDKDDLNSALEVQIYDGDTLLTTLKANKARDDVNKAFNTTGNHGYSGTYSIQLSGSHKITVKALDLGTNKQYTLGSKTITVQKAYTSNYTIKGSLDLIQCSTNGILTFGGWAFDQDNLEDSVEIEVCNGNKVLGTIQANELRSDVNQLYHISGKYGFTGSIDISSLSGNQTITIKAKELGGSGEVVLGSKEVSLASKTLSTTKTYTNNHLVIGWIEKVQYTDGKLYVGGWAYDQDALSDAVSIKVYANNTLLSTLSANQVRSDVNTTMKVTGNHGFSGTIPVSLTGNYTVKVVAVDLGSNQEVVLTNQSMTFGAVSNSSLPVGCVDFITPLSNRQVNLAGWSYDPDSPSTGLSIKVYCDGKWIDTLTSNTNRTDVNKAYSITGIHGFSKTITLTAGTHLIELYAVDVNGKDMKSIGSKTITVTNNTTSHLQAAYKEIGTVGGSKYNAFCGIPSSSAWCAAFVSWCGGQGGILGTKIPMFVWVDNGVNWYKSKGLFTSTPKSGYVIFFDYNRDGSCDHVGFVDSVDSNYVYTIEGNYGSATSSPTKNKVARGQYPIHSSSIYGYGIIE